MKPSSAPRALLASLLLLLALAQAGCAGLQPSSPAARSADPALLHDTLFQPVAVPTAQALFALSPAMQRYLAHEIAGQVRLRGAQDGLIDALYTRSMLQLRYDPAATLTAQEAFEQRHGNCLTLVIMTAAFAREMGLAVQYRRVHADTSYSRRGGLTLQSGHVNLGLGRVLAERRAGLEQDRWLVVDFLPAHEVRGHRSDEIDEATLVALFHVNRAADALADGAIDTAYAHARAAVTAAPGHAAAYNVLAVAYWRRGHLGLAEAALRAGHALEPANTALLSNLTSVLRAAGREAEALVVARQLAALEPYPPYHFFDLGMAALNRDEPALARDWFARELARDEEQAEVHFWMAVAQARLGDGRQARWHLAAAAER
ncbi:MAG: hypothetical protein ACKVQR_16745, partial [Aquabacterium sp.]